MKEPIFELPMLTLTVYFFFTYLMTLWTYGVGAATGLFVPSLVAGACMGRMTGRYAEGERMHTLCLVIY